MSPTQLSENGGPGSSTRDFKGRGQNQATGRPEMAQAGWASEDTNPSRARGLPDRSASPLLTVGWGFLPCLALGALGGAMPEWAGDCCSTVMSALDASHSQSTLQRPWPAGEAPGGEPRQAPARPLQGPAAGSSSSRPTPPAGAAAALRPGSSSLGCQAPVCLLRPGTPQRREGGMSKGNEERAVGWDIDFPKARGTKAKG